MRVAALCDIHGMPWALQAVLGEAKNEADSMVVVGDIFDGPYGDEAYALVASSGAVIVRGNSDDADPRTANAPLTAEIDGVVYCHATPNDNTLITTAATPDADVAELFGDRGTFVIGHTHHQFDRRIGDLRVINAGSVGMPYEDEVAAFWVLVVDGEPRFRRTPFDVAQAVRELQASGWAGADGFIAENLLTAPSRAEAIAYFETLR